MIGTVVGKETKTYTKDGVVKNFRQLYVVWDKPKHPQDGFEGKRCETLTVPFEFPPCVVIDKRLNFEFETVSGRAGLMARLVDITSV